MKKSKMGRPKLKPSERRSKVISIRANQAELARLKAEALRTGQTLSEILMRPWRRTRRKGE